MRWKNDEKLALKVPEIDLILGGNQLTSTKPDIYHSNT